MGILALLGILIAPLIAIALWAIMVYNGLVQLRNEVKNAWSQIDVQLKRRHDLIPNLIETVKGYMTHERDTLENITRARSAAINASGVKETAQAENMLSQALGGLRVAVEAYPDLKANTTFLQLQEELTSTENKISFARQFFNDQVLSLNNKIEMFPSNLVAMLFGFKKEDFFEIEETEKAVPKVSFS